MRPGDIVVRTYGEHPRPKGFVIREEPLYASPIGPRYWRVRWFGRARKEEVEEARWLEVYSEAR